MRTDDLELALAIHRDSITDRKAVLFKSPLVKHNWLSSSFLFYEKKDDTLNQKILDIYHFFDKFIF